MLGFLTIWPPKDTIVNKMVKNCFEKAAVILLGVREATGDCPCTQESFSWKQTSFLTYLQFYFRL